MSVIVPLSEQLAKPLPNAIVLVDLNELSTGAHKLLPKGTRLAITVPGDEPYEELDILKNVDDITMLLHDLPLVEEKLSRVHAARRLFEYLEENSLNFSVIHHIQFLKGIHKCDFDLAEKKRILRVGKYNFSYTGREIGRDDLVLKKYNPLPFVYSQGCLQSHCVLRMYFFSFFFFFGNSYIVLSRTITK